MAKKGTVEDLANRISALSKRLRNATAELMSEKLEKGVELSNSRQDALLEALITARKTGNIGEENIIMEKMAVLGNMDNIEQDLINKIIAKKIKDLFKL